ncbi:MAG: hypothetical protein ABI386_08460 [Rhodanobacter sp.]
MSMHTEHRWRRRECSYRLRGVPLDGILFDQLCTGPAYDEAHPHRRVEGELAGWRGRPGFYISGFRHLLDLGAYLR